MVKAAMPVSVQIPDSVKGRTAEIQDELTWLVTEIEDLVEADNLEEFGSTLDAVMDYVEDLHSALESLETEVKKREKG